MYVLRKVIEDIDISVQVCLEIIMPTPSVDLATLWQTSVHGHSSSSSLSSLWSLLMFSLISLIHCGEYMTVSRSSAIVNITYYSPVTDSIYSEVSRFAELLSHWLHYFLLE